MTRKYTVLPFVMIFALILALAAFLIGGARFRETTARATSLDRRVTSNGVIVEMIDVGGDVLSLRKIAPDGRVEGYLRLPAAASEDRFSAYHVVGLIGDQLYLYHYESPGDTPERFNETIIAYDVNDDSLRVVAYPPAPENLDGYDVFRAVDLRAKEAYIGYFHRETRRLTVWRIDSVSGDITSAYDADAPFSLAAISVAAGETYALTRDSDVYKLDGEWRRVFEAAPGETAINMMAGADGRVYLFLVEGAGLRVAVSTEEGFEPFDVGANDFKRIYIADAENWVALDRHHHYVYSVGGERFTLGELTAAFTLLWDAKSLLTLLATALIAAVVLAAARRVWLRRKLWLLAKLLLAILPTFTLGTFFLVTVAATFVSSSMERDVVQALLENADETVSGIDGRKFARIDWNDPLNDAYYTSLAERVEELSKSRTLTMLGEEGEERHIGLVSYWIYKVEGFDVYAATCGNLVIGLETAYFENVPENAARDVMLREGKPTYAHVDGIESEMRWLAIQYPILDESEIVGYLEVARPYVAIDAAVRSVRREIAYAGVLVFAAVLVVIVPILALSTRTLRKLKRGAIAVSGGDYKARVASRSWDETGEIAAAFNVMAQSVESSVDYITAVGYGYSRFVPNRLMELLSKKSIREIQPGDHVNLTATQILLFTDSFDAIADQAFFDALGRFYDAVTSCIAAGGGLASGYSARGFISMFEAAPQETISSVLATYDALDRLGGVECHAFMNYSDVALGVTGNGGHLNMIAASRLSYESYDVGMTGKRFGARLIVAQSAYQAMGRAAEKYRHRYLGVLLADGKEHDLYDFFDCDTPEIRLKKSDVKESFERGVRAYYAMDYALARSVFIDVVKEFPQDLAAREYLLRSHAGQESGGKPKPILELR